MSESSGGFPQPAQGDKNPKVISRRTFLKTAVGLTGAEITRRALGAPQPAQAESAKSPTQKPVDSKPEEKSAEKNMNAAFPEFNTLVATGEEISSTNGYSIHEWRNGPNNTDPMIRMVTFKPENLDIVTTGSPHLEPDPKTGQGQLKWVDGNPRHNQGVTSYIEKAIAEGAASISLGNFTKGDELLNHNRGEPQGILIVDPTDIPKVADHLPYWYPTLTLYKDGNYTFGRVNKDVMMGQKDQIRGNVNVVLKVFDESSKDTVANATSSHNLNTVKQALRDVNSAPDGRQFGKDKTAETALDRTLDYNDKDNGIPRPVAYIGEDYDGNLVYALSTGVDQINFLGGLASSSNLKSLWMLDGGGSGHAVAPGTDNGNSNPHLATIAFAGRIRP
jgi:hypothetical protein